MSASPMSKIPVLTRETGNNLIHRGQHENESDTTSSDEDSGPPPIPPTKPPAKNPHPNPNTNVKEKTIEALNIIYARKPTPSTISTSSFAPGDDKQRPITITATTIRNDTEIVKNLPPIPSAAPGGNYYSSSKGKNIQIPVSISPQPIPTSTPTPAVRTPGLWFNMTDEYPVENFSGRESILEEIDTIVQGVKSRDARPISRAIILLGEPSVGKTEIARKFAFKFYVHHDGCANVVWINASSQDSIKESLLQLDDFELRQRLEKSSSSKNPVLVDQSSVEQLQISGLNDNDDDDERPKSPKSPSSPVSPTPTSMSMSTDGGGDVYEPAVKAKPSPKSPPKRKNNSSFKSKTTRKQQQQQNEFDDLDNDARIESVLRNPIFQELPTLFIFDDAKREEDVIKYLPKLSPVGHIPNCLITSSSENEGYWNNSRIIKVPLFDIADAVHFLLESFKDIPEFTRNQAHWLAKELYYFPPLLQRARKMVLQYLTEGDSVRAMSRLEQNVGLVRRLTGCAIQHKELEIAVLNVDRGNYFEEDPYIREFEGEIRTHPLSLRLHQIEAILPSISRQPELTILAINEEAYIMSILSHLTGPSSKIIGVYDNENYGEETIAEQLLALNKDNPELLKEGRIELRLVETPKGKSAKKSKITQVLEKLRAADGKLQYNVILTSLYFDSDFTPVKRLLQKDGRFITSMSSSNVSLALKKVDSKKLEIKMLKKDFPELLVNLHKL